MHQCHEFDAAEFMHMVRVGWRSQRGIDIAIGRADNEHATRSQNPMDFV